MLTLMSKRRGTTCNGVTRRDFLQVGSLGVAGLTLPDLMRAKAAANQSGTSIRSKSVIWLWLSGGPTHVETFDPKMTAPVEYRSMTGDVATSIPGVTIGGGFPKIAAVADKMALVRSFAHGSSSHGTATTWVMTGYNDRSQMKPSLGSIIARQNGTNHPDTGMPTYVRIGRIRSDGPGWLGARFAPFDPSGQARKNLQVTVPADRFTSRRELLNQLDGINRTIDGSGKMDGLDGFESQAFELILGNAQDAFDINKEDPKVRAHYGRGLGENLLKAKRLCDAGCGLVTVSYGGWDMHSNLVRSLKRRGEEVDRAVSALVQDLDETGMLDDTLVVVTGEFGRTPRINKRAGRDHWGRLCTLAFAGGGLRMGQVIGESSPRGEVPASTPVTPQDVMATLLHIYGIDPGLQFVSNQGRPTFMIEDGKPIPELV